MICGFHREGNRVDSHYISDHLVIPKKMVKKTEEDCHEMKLKRLKKEVGDFKIPVKTRVGGLVVQGQLTPHNLGRFVPLERQVSSSVATPVDMFSEQAKANLRIINDAWRQHWITPLEALRRLQVVKQEIIQAQRDDLLAENAQRLRLEAMLVEQGERMLAAELQSDRFEADLRNQTPFERVETLGRMGFEIQGTRGRGLGHRLVTQEEESDLQGQMSRERQRRAAMVQRTEALAMEREIERRVIEQINPRDLQQTFNQMTQPEPEIKEEEIVEQPEIEMREFQPRPGRTLERQPPVIKRESAPSPVPF